MQTPHWDEHTDAPGARPGLTRRGLMATAVPMAAIAAAPWAAHAGGALGLGLGADRLGYDPASGRYTLPDLPYAPDALEPHIDAETMRIHHGKHHAGYVRGLNTALDKLAEIRAGTGDASLIKHWSRELSFHGSGHVNHTLFWLCMAPTDRAAGMKPTGGLAEAIDRDFGGFDAFKTHFAAASRFVEGSGWGWLGWEPFARKLLVMQGEKQQNLDITGTIPLMGVDVWEHAYYLRYQNRRGDYVAAFMNVINWDWVSRRFEAIARG